MIQYMAILILVMIFTDVSPFSDVSHLVDSFSYIILSMSLLHILVVLTITMPQT